MPLRDSQRGVDAPWLFDARPAVCESPPRLAGRPRLPSDQLDAPPLPSLRAGARSPLASARGSEHHSLRRLGQSKPGGGVKPTISFSMKRLKAVAVLSRPLAAMAW